MIRSRWQALWLAHSQRRGWLAWLLWPLSLVYGCLMAVRRGLYAIGFFRTQRIPLPVIVVGNVVVGGAGKTPTVIAVVNHLQAQGWRPGVVSRGHGRHNTAVVDVGPDTLPEDSGDEPALIHRRTGVPVCVATSRVAAANKLTAAYPEVNIVVCDDGLQHWALHRDLQIVVFDDRGTGNGWLLPAGMLREPWPRRGSDQTPADLVLQQQRADTEATRKVSAPGTRLFSATRQLAAHAVGPAGETMSLQALRAQRTTAVAGIARPSVFFDMLRALGLTPEQTVGLPDHADAVDYTAVLQDPERVLLCTEKDAVKLFPLLSQLPKTRRAQVWAVPLELTPDPSFFSALDDSLRAFKRKP